MIAPARGAALSVLLDVGAGRRHLDDALARVRPSLADRRDVHLLTELATGVLRWRSRLDYELEPHSTRPLSRLDPEVLEVLRLGVYQLRFLTRVPVAAVVDDAVALVRRARKSSAAGLVNAVLRRVSTSPPRALPPRPDAPDAAVAAWVRHLAVAHAHPEWLVARWIEAHGVAAAEARLAFDNRPPGITLRVIERDRAAAAARLAAAGIETTPCRYAAAGLIVTGGDGAALAAGTDVAWAVQDEGSQLIGDLAPIEAGARVVDVAAAPGGKTLQYMARTGPAGLVVACDVRARRVAALARRLLPPAAGRGGVVHVDERAALPFRAVFDVVAVDAPCSGLGSLRRNPDIKWRRTAADLARYAALQHDLLDRSAAVVGPGGALVYSTCSTEPEENAAIVERFLARTPAFALEAPRHVPAALVTQGCVITTPESHALEGYFGAALRRRSG